MAQMILQGVAAFGHFAPPVVVYAKQPVQARGNRTLMCFPSEYTTYVFCVNCAGRKWDIVKRFRDFMQFEAKLVLSPPVMSSHARAAPRRRGRPSAAHGARPFDARYDLSRPARTADRVVPRGAPRGAGADPREELLPLQLPELHRAPPLVPRPRPRRPPPASTHVSARTPRCLAGLRPAAAPRARARGGARRARRRLEMYINSLAHCPAVLPRRRRRRRRRRRPPCPSVESAGSTLRSGAKELKGHRSLTEGRRPLTADPPRACPGGALGHVQAVPRVRLRRPRRPRPAPPPPPRAPEASSLFLERGFPAAGAKRASSPRAARARAADARAGARAGRR